MPTYDYFCKTCNQTKEVFQKITDQPLTECPQCHQHTFSRKPSGGIGLAFSGDGFYSTMYGDKKASKESGSCCPCGKNTSCDKSSKAS